MRKQIKIGPLRATSPLKFGPSPLKSVTTSKSDKLLMNKLRSSSLLPSATLRPPPLARPVKFLLPGIGFLGERAESWPAIPVTQATVSGQGRASRGTLVLPKRKRKRRGALRIQLTRRSGNGRSGRTVNREPCCRPGMRQADARVY